MKISSDWLSDFVDLSGISSEELADKLTVRTSEVEGFEVVRRHVANMAVVDVVTCVPFVIEGDRVRHEVTVHDGTRSYATVCGAPNVRAGMKAIFAHVGATLGNGNVVSATTLYGRLSEGVLCSPAEAGVSSGTDALLELPDLPAGTPLATLVAETDTIIEIDNKSLTHRPDLWGHYGFAREMASIFGRTLRGFPTADLAAHDHLPAWPITVEDARDCPLYSAIALDVAKNPASSLKIQSRLGVLGNTPINTLVDVTNYVMLELGQPTHAFDRRGMDRIHVGRAGSHTSFVTLDGKSWKLLPDDLMIYEGDTPSAMAGVMGGAASRVLPDTRSILLESANFRGSRIRGTSVRLSLRTDASLRFEKKLPPSYARTATSRILLHLQEAGVSPTPASRFSSVGDPKVAPRTISLPAGWMAKRAGAAISNAEVSSILGSIGMTVTEQADGGLDVSVPAFRGVEDISIPEDISEEVMRLYGYDRITPTSPKGPLAPVAPHVPTRNHHRARRILAQGHGFSEVQTYGWVSDDWTEVLGYSVRSPLTLRNPIAVGRSNMRDTLVPNLLAVAHQNRRIEPAFRVFELGRVFWIDNEGQKQEENHLAGVAVDQSAASGERLFRAIRGALEDVATAAGLGTFVFTKADAEPDFPWIKAGRTLQISRDGAVVGHIGLLPSDLTGKVLDAGHLVWFSLRTVAIESELYPTTPYQPAPQFPGSWQDFTFAWPIERGFGGLEALLDTFTHPVLDKRGFITMYQAKGSDTGKYSFRFSLRRVETTLSTEDIEDFRAKFLAFAAEHGLVIA